MNYGQRDVLLAKFPFTDGTGVKLRPVLLLTQIPGQYPDYLVMFISSQLHIAEKSTDFILDPNHPEFPSTGLKTRSVFRSLKLGTISEALVVGGLGKVSPTLSNTIIQPLISSISLSSET